MRMGHIALLLYILIPTYMLGQADCAQTSIGLVSIMDLGAGTYNGWTVPGWI